MNEIDQLVAHRKIADDAHNENVQRLDQIIVSLTAHQCHAPEGARLDIPWLSQLGPSADYARGDCGPGVIAMWLLFLGHSVSVDMASRATGKPHNFSFTSVGDLVRIAAHWDLSLIWSRNQALASLYAQIDEGKPVVALVYYKALPVRYDPNYPWCHWVLVTGYGEGKVIYHDPYYRDGAGANVEISEKEFLVAWNSNYIAGNSNRQMLSEVK